MKEKIRVSMGTLRVLGMEILETDADPMTAYLQTYEPGRCSQSCGFCAQAKTSSADTKNIARGLYPPRDTKEVVERLSKAYKHELLFRACVQTMNYENMLEDLLYIVKEIRKASDIPVSVSVYPLPEESYRELRRAGIDKIVIPLDASTEKIFDKVKGKDAGCDYTWGSHLTSLGDAVRVMGKGNVGTHLIIGLGETEEEACGTIQMLAYSGVYPALFAYTPVPETKLIKRAPDIGHYRRIQVACHLIASSISFYSRMEFAEGRITGFGIREDYLNAIIESGEPFMTKGCEDCNRPYSTEEPGGIIYNYPKKPKEKEIDQIKKQVVQGL